MDLEHVVPSLREVYSRHSAYAITLLTAFLVLVFYASLTNVTLLRTAFASYPLPAALTITLSLIPGIQSSAGTTIFISILLLSLLVGVNVAMLVHKARAYGIAPREGGSSMGGVALAAFGSGCPACATGLLTLAGVSGGLAVLPFGGWEFRAASFILLLLPIYWISRDIAHEGACPI